MAKPSTIRVGAVNYLNTKPLIYGLSESAAHIELVLDLPSRLADDLAAGRLDVALIPSIECFQNPTYTIVSDACIGCRGPVWSVKLFSRVEPARIRTLALDEGSRTSAALVRILLNQRYGIEPELLPLPIGHTVQDTQADAVLLIGDRAMHSPPGPFAEVWDLGDQWCRWSELPMVFAMWTARPGVPLDLVDGPLREARDAGLANIETIAEREAAALGLSHPECVQYLKHHLHFHLGPREQQGLQLYYDLASRMGLAPEGVDLGYLDCSASG